MDINIPVGGVNGYTRELPSYLPLQEMEAGGREDEDF